MQLLFFYLKIYDCLTKIMAVFGINCQKFLKDQPKLQNIQQIKFNLVFEVAITIQIQNLSTQLKDCPLQNLFFFNKFKKIVEKNFRERMHYVLSHMAMHIYRRNFKLSIFLAYALLKPGRYPCENLSAKKNKNRGKKLSC